MGEREYPNFYALLLKLSLKTRGLISATLGCTWVRAIFGCEAQCELHDVAQTEGRKVRRGLQDARRGTGRRTCGAGHGTLGAAQVVGRWGGARRRAPCRSRDVRRSAECTGARGSRFPRWKDRLPGCDAGRGTQNAARNQNAAWDARGSRFPVGGVASRRIGDEGMKGERDVKRCPPTLHSWAPSR
jgi:hypothetical protein